jgi:hypothetical protein
LRLLAAIGAAGLLAAACALPFGGPSLATTAELINGAAAGFAQASGFEVAGAFDDTTTSYTMDIQFTAPTTAHVFVNKGNLKIELIQIDAKEYYRGKDYLASQVGSDAAAQRLIRAIGDRWFTSKSATPVDLSGFTDAFKLKAGFLTNFAVARKDNVSSGGLMTAQLTAGGYILNITEASPHHLVQVSTTHGTIVDNKYANAKFAFSNYNKTFGIAPPTSVFDIDDKSTWPPLYSAVSIENSRCSDPCVLSAVLRNTGGLTGAPSPSTVTFSLLDSSNQVLGSCKVAITPDVPNGQQVTESCSISSAAWTNYRSTYTYEAVPDNPAYD